MRPTTVNELEERLLTWLSKEKLAEIYFTSDSPEIKMKILKRAEILNKPIGGF